MLNFGIQDNLAIQREDLRAALDKFAQITADLAKYRFGTDREGQPRRPVMGGFLVSCPNGS